MSLKWLIFRSLIDENKMNDCMSVNDRTGTFIHINSLIGCIITNMLVTFLAGRGSSTR